MFSYFKKIASWLKRRNNFKIFSDIYDVYKEYTMTAKYVYINNLSLALKFKNADGAIVECGTWRGGMIGGIAKLFSDERDYYLFDSFEGLPKALPIDGEAAIAWQNNTDSPIYYDNCRAEMSFAENAMRLAGVKNAHIVKGWFSETLPQFDKKKTIAILRLDADWYNSTMDCLVNLYPCVADGGVIIFDDYFTWEGCSKAVHDFLSQQKLPWAIRQWNNDNIAYIVKGYL